MLNIIILETSRAKIFVLLSLKIIIFLRYYWILYGLMAYVSLLCGAMVTYPIVGQYVPATYCKHNNMISISPNETSLEHFIQKQTELMKNETLVSMNCELKDHLIHLNDDSNSCKEYIYDTSMMQETIGKHHFFDIN